MKMLCALSDWKTETVERGRSIGNEVTSRTVLAMDGWNHILGTQRGGKDDSSIVGEVFFPSMRLVFAKICEKAEEDGLSPVSPIKAVVKSLEARCGKKAPEMPSKLNADTLEAYGRTIDRHFDVIFGKYQGKFEFPPKVTKRLFGSEENE